eukprot:TRINITY_DN7693_c0_g1_i2.p1 TRINITY_DN7693_c0_g1~~TRINITY_DN7693_c0_g1_i2.p1  ORF type:complete len:341 (-),score=117.69 TRINITY_DN7693_c0_g1_i2:267-1289(-)
MAMEAAEGSAAGREGEAAEKIHPWAIALHAGAGGYSRQTKAEEYENFKEELERILHVGVDALKAGRSAVDVVELVVTELENCPLFNAGKGSVLTSAGTIEMEACVQDGFTGNVGAVAGLKTVVNPVSLARLVMEKTTHVLLGFDGAEKFATVQGVERQPNEFFMVEKRKMQLEQAKKLNRVQVDHTPEDEANAEGREAAAAAPGETGTVGCTVVDIRGHCAAATSSGGLTNKLEGRVGGSPLPGAGTYANRVCAVSATGRGEFITKATVGRTIAALVEYKGLTLRQAVDEVLFTQMEKGTCGAISVSSDGQVATGHNTKSMFHAYASELEGKFVVKAFGE